MLSSRSLCASPSPLYRFISLSPSLSLVSSLFPFLLPASLRSSCRAEVNVQAHGVTEITHTLVANPLDCDSSPRLYLASNCSFFVNDAPWSTCRPRFRVHARAPRPRRRTFEESRKNSLRTFNSSDETWRVARLDGFERRDAYMISAGRRLYSPKVIYKITVTSRVFIFLHLFAFF